MGVNRDPMAVRDGSAGYDLQAATPTLPVGYKQTEVGVIPEDWNIGFVGDFYEITSSRRVFQSEWRKSGIPFYRTREIAILAERGEVDNDLYIDETLYATYTKLYGVPKCGDLLVTGIGTIGKAYLVPENSKFYFKDASVLWLSSKKIYDSIFLNYLYESPSILDQVCNSSTGTTVDTYTISGAKRTLVPQPPLDEQRAIATALSDVDALLEGLDRLIAKKRDLKQAAMQQLLTGQTRLPRFEGEWETMPLEEVADIRSGGTPSTTNQDFWNGGVPWCTPTDITALRGRKYLTETERTISTKGLQTSSAEIIPPKSIIMTTRATIGECAINTIPMTTNQGFKNLVPSTADSEFFYYLMTTQKQRLIQLCGGSTFLEVGKKQLQTFEVKLPVDIGEQTAIATVLSDMDAEIEALEKRRAKTAALKQAMMQELLTGRTRLVKPHKDEEAVRV